MSDKPTENQPDTHHEAKIVKLVERDDGSSALEIQVNIEGLPPSLWLSLDALTNLGLTGLVVAKEIRELHGKIGELNGKIGQLHNGLALGPVRRLDELVSVLSRKQNQ